MAPDDAVCLLFCCVLNGMVDLRLCVVCSEERQAESNKVMYCEWIAADTGRSAAAAVAVAAAGATGALAPTRSDTLLAMAEDDEEDPAARRARARASRLAEQVF